MDQLVSICHRLLRLGSAKTWLELGGRSRQAEIMSIGLRVSSGSIHHQPMLLHRPVLKVRLASKSHTKPAACGVGSPPPRSTYIFPGPPGRLRRQFGQVLSGRSPFFYAVAARSRFSRVLTGSGEPSRSRGTTCRKNSDRGSSQCCAKLGQLPPEHWHWPQEQIEP